MHSLAVSFELTFCVSTLKSKWLLKMLKKRSKVKFGNPFGLKKVENKTRCQVCFDNGVNTIYNVQSRSSVI